ncbi:phosphatidate cytidylyltransferase [candidate division KSB1 bacterium]|nr:phosphatidate cytidylyltransferase [candidate division KSB1 bacterium]
MNIKSFSVRALIALFFGPVILYTAWIGGLSWYLFVTLIVLLSVYEYYDLSVKRGVQPLFVPGGILALAITSGFYFYSEYALLPILIVALTIFLFVELYRKNGSPLLNSSVHFFAPVFYGVMFGSFILIRGMERNFGLQSDYGGSWILLLIGATWVCDTAAYVVGSYFGRHKLMPRISPNKSIEGSAAGFLFSLLTAYIGYRYFVQGLRLQDALIIGAVVGSLGQYGDLFESMIKRDVQAKDSSRLIPGHGGILDRFDSLTISAPLVYLYLREFFF